MLAQTVLLKALAKASARLTQSQAITRMPVGISVSFLTLLFVGPVLIAALSFQEATPLFWSILILDLVLLFGVALATFRRPVLFVGVIVLWFVLQRLVVALLAPHVSAEVVRLLLTYKEGFYLILVAAGIATLLLRYARGERALTPILIADLIAIAFLGFLALELLFSPAPLSPQLTYLRRFAAPLLFYLGGRLLIARSDQFSESLRLLLGIGLLVALFGVIERFFLGAAFWQDNVDAAGFYAKQTETGLLPGDWLTVFRGLPDGIFIALPLEVPVRRLVSTYLEPTTLGSFLALTLVLLLLVPGLSSGRHRLAVGLGVALLAFALVATLSRGAMLTVLAAVALFILIRLLQRVWRWRYLALAPVVALLGLGLVLTTLSFSQAPAVRDRVQDLLATSTVSGFPQVSTTAGVTPQEFVHPPGSTAEGAVTHRQGLTSGLETLLENPLGLGLGAAGAWSEAPEVGSESNVGTIAAQLGIFGLALWLAFFLSLIVSLAFASLRYRRRGQTLQSDVTLALAAALFGLFVIAWFSESASGLLGNAFYFLFAGWALAQASPAASQVRFRWLPAPANGEEG